MQALVEENNQLQEESNRLAKQLKDLLDIKSQHETQIQTLLKFNEKLLTIIEKELNGQKLKKSDIMSLQPISERTEVQSQMFQSQFTNVGNQILLKKSVNLKYDHPLQRSLKPYQIAISENDEIVSIDINENEKFQQSDRQIKSLTKEFNKKIKVREEQLSIEEIQKRFKEDCQNLKKLKQDFTTSCVKKIEDLNNYKQSLQKVDVKQKLITMLDQQQQNNSTNLVKSLIAAL